MGEKKLNGLGLKVLSILIVVMFVAVATVCPVVRSDESSAEAADTKNEEETLPDEVISEYITEELDKISEMNNEQLVEEFGVTMDEYQSSMEALAGSTLMLVGDENGSITIEISDTVDRGRGGFWYEGNYFFFGIESVAWSAIKWWFSDDCINMLVDQICQGDIDAVALVENELNQEAESLKTLVNDIVNIGSAIEKIKAEIELIDDAILKTTVEFDELSDEMVAAYENDLADYEKRLELTEDEIETCGELIERSSEVNIAENFLELDDGEKVKVIENIGKFLNGVTQIVGIDLTGTEFAGYGYLFAYIMAGNYIEAYKEVDEGLRQQSENFADNVMNGQIKRIAKELTDTLEKLKAEKETYKNAITSCKNAIKEAKELKKTARDFLKSYDEDVKKLEDFKERSKNADVDLQDSIKQYENAIDRLNDARSKCDRGEISFDDYKAEKARFDKAQDNMWDKRKVSLEWREKVDCLNKTVKEKSLSVEKNKLDIKNSSKTIKENKIVKLKNKASTLKTSLQAAKAGAKAVAKATAKTACKSAICSTGIGAVIMIAVDIVMALLIKFIEDHISDQGDVYDDYGILVKVQVFEQYTVHQTFKIFWRTVTIHFEVTAPCIPRLDGVYKQW